MKICKQKKDEAQKEIDAEILDAENEIKKFKKNHSIK